MYKNKHSVVRTRHDSPQLVACEPSHRRRRQLFDGSALFLIRCRGLHIFVYTQIVIRLSPNQEIIGRLGFVFIFFRRQSKLPVTFVNTLPWQNIEHFCQTINTVLSQKKVREEPENNIVFFSR